MDYYIKYFNLKNDIYECDNFQVEEIQIAFRKRIAVDEMFIEYDNYLTLEEKTSWHTKYGDLLELLNNN
jgi:hypothetical protein